MSTKDLWHWVSARGRVVKVDPDEDLAFIDRISRKFTGSNYFRRAPRRVCTIAIDRLSRSH